MAFIIIYIVGAILAGILGSIAEALGSLVNVILILGLFALIIPSLALTFRRIQDCGKPGFFMFIPIYGFILTLTEGTHGDNEYGPDPKAIEKK